MTERYYRNRRAGVVDRAVHLPLPAAENDRVAKLAEDYFCDLYGLPHDDGLRPKNAEIEVGPASIDVKWTPLLRGRLIHRLDSRTRCTYYVLVVNQPEDFHLAGWAWGFELRASVMDLGHGRTYALDQEKLHQNVDLMMATLYLVRVS